MMIKNKFLHFTFLLTICSYSLLGQGTIVKTISPELAIGEVGYELRMENVVNLQTPGYKEIKSTTVINQNNSNHVIFYRNFKPGSLVKTGNTLDFALEGSGFFTVQTPLGLAYTRDGRFTVGPNGRLFARTEAYPVLGEYGEIIIPERKITVSNDGYIWSKDMQLGRLKVTRIKNKQNLVSLNGVFFLADKQKPLDVLPEEDYKIRQGYIENSNVNSVEQLGKMASDKSYDLKAKILQMELQRISKISEMLR